MCTYTECVLGTTEKVTWTRPGRNWTEGEVKELRQQFNDGWEERFGE